MPAAVGCHGCAAVRPSCVGNRFPAGGSRVVPSHLALLAQLIQPEVGEIRFPLRAAEVNGIALALERDLARGEQHVVRVAILGRDGEIVRHGPGRRLHVHAVVALKAAAAAVVRGIHFAHRADEHAVSLGRDQPPSRADLLQVEGGAGLADDPLDSAVAVQGRFTKAGPSNNQENRCESEPNAHCAIDGFHDCGSFVLGIAAWPTGQAGFFEVRCRGARGRSESRRRGPACLGRRGGRPRPHARTCARNERDSPHSDPKRRRLRRYRLPWRKPA